jgi:hypothetical protein
LYVLIWLPFFIWTDTSKWQKLGILKTTEYYFSSSGIWAVQDQGICGFCVWAKSTLWFVEDSFSLCSHGERGKGFFYKSNNLIHKGSIPYNLMAFIKQHLLIFAFWGLKFQHMNSGRMQIFRPQQWLKHMRV